MRFIVLLLIFNTKPVGTGNNAVRSKNFFAKLEPFIIKETVSLTLHDPSFIRTDRPTKALTADRDGFSLNAAVSCQSYQRDRLERL